MKFLSRLALILLLSAPVVYPQGGTISLAPEQDVLLEPGNLVLEHALSDYHHYYPKACDIKMVDFYINPFYKHWQTIGAEDKDKRSVNAVGSFLQGQVNFGDLWVRANTIFGYIKENRGDEATLVDKERKDRSEFGIDDIIVKAGYDFFFNSDDHVGIYAMAGFPTKRNLRSHVEEDKDKKSEIKQVPFLAVENPEFGTKHYRVGGGINSGFTVYACDDHHLAWMFDAQYHYAFPTSYFSVSGKADEKDGKAGSAEIRLTPGHTVNGWTALHYAYDAWNVELGSAFTATFGKQVGFHGEDKEGNSAEIMVPADADNKFGIKSEQLKTPETVKFGATPYVAASYNTTICDNPATLGVGVGYDFNRTHREAKSNAFQGALAWVTAAVSF